MWDARAGSPCARGVHSSEELWTQRGFEGAPLSSSVRRREGEGSDRSREGDVPAQCGATPVAIATAGQPSRAHTTTRTTYSGSGSEAAPRFRYRFAPLAALAVFCRPHCGDGDAGDLASHWLTRLFSWD